MPRLFCIVHCLLGDASCIAPVRNDAGSLRFMSCMLMRLAQHDCPQCQAAAGTQLWRTKVDAAVFAPICVLQHDPAGLAIVATDQGALHGVHAGSGHIKWSVQVSSKGACNTEPAIWPVNVGEPAQCQMTDAVHSNDSAPEWIPRSSSSSSSCNSSTCFDRSTSMEQETCLAFVCGSGELCMVSLRGPQAPVVALRLVVASEGMFSAPVWLTKQHVVFGGRDDCLHCLWLPLHRC